MSYWKNLKFTEVLTNARETKNEKKRTKGARVRDKIFVPSCAPFLSRSEEVE